MVEGFVFGFLMGMAVLLLVGVFVLDYSPFSSKALQSRIKDLEYQLEAFERMRKDMEYAVEQRNRKLEKIRNTLDGTV